MKQRRVWLIALLILCLALILSGCEKNDDDDDDDAPPADDDAVTDDDQVADDDLADDDATDDDAAPEQVQKFRLDLDFEVDFDAVLHLRQYPDDTLSGRLIPAAGFDVIAADIALEGEGRLLRFPEAFGRMVTLKLSGPAVPGSPCGEQPISYSLTLTAKEDNGYMVGGLTAYCGENTYFGRPARVMRLSGLQTHEN